jgi:hypothetical protein
MHISIVELAVTRGTKRRGKMEKVYCAHCLHFCWRIKLHEGHCSKIPLNEQIYCGHPTNLIHTQDTWYLPIRTYKTTPEVLNEKNNCKNYKSRMHHKRQIENNIVKRAKQAEQEDTKPKWWNIRRKT